MSEYKVVSSPVLYPEVQELKTSIKVLDTHINLQWLLRHFSAVVRNNLMKRRWEVTLPGHFIFPEDAENSAISLVKYLATVNGFPRPTLSSIGQHIKTLAEENSYHPIVDGILAVKHDGIPRLEKFIDTLKSVDRDLMQVLVRTWMVSAIAAIFSPKGFVCHGVLVLQGKQNIGKTGWIKALDPFNCGAVLEGAHLDPTNKDDKINAGEHWIVELGELDSTFKKDIARLKAYITSSADHIRTPYAVKASHYYRRTVFAASVNRIDFLLDETGNRRWWTIGLTAIDFSTKYDMQQIWAEVYALWLAGHPTILSAEDQERVNKSNRNYEKKDSLHEKLVLHYDWASISTREMTTTQVLEELGYKNPDPGITSRGGKLIKQLALGSGRLLDGVWRHNVPSFKPNPLIKTFSN